ncbi:hypothetical protein HWV62_43624 [Athelia sp. TMB]|nr:hypothetical protein HWV62_43624 [Athelia sp. TMB]
MFSLRSFVVVATLLAFFHSGDNGLVTAKPTSHLQKRQCTATLTIADDLHNLMLATGNDQFGTVADSSYIGKAALNSGTNWSNFIGGSYDDAQWVILALWKIADYKSARGLSASAYLVKYTLEILRHQFLTYDSYHIRTAQRLFTILSQANGTLGLWWSSAHTYKNAITNELFLLTSASGYLRGGGSTYLANAQKTWAWYYVDLQPASGLSALYAATGDSTLLTQAEITLDATISQLSTNNILKESCDNAASATGQCNHDQQSFKGIWTKHLQYYLDTANSASRNAKYSGFLGSQLSAVIHYGTDASDDVGSVWYAPNAGGSVFTPETSASGLAAIVAAAKYGPC